MSRKHEWRAISEYYRDLAEQLNEDLNRTKEALGRVWITVEAAVHDPGLANTLRMAFMGELLPGMVVNYADEPDDEEDEQ